MNTDAWQAVALALSTFVQEDVPTLGAALLASAGKLNWRVAFIACFAGIWIGDALLYGLARGAGRPLLETRFARRFISASAVTRGEAWFRRRGMLALVLSRFVPGLRLPTYFAAGFLRVSFLKFLLVTGGAVLVWTTTLFVGAHWLGDRARAAFQDASLALGLAGGTLFAGLVSYRKGARALARFNVRMTQVQVDVTDSVTPRVMWLKGRAPLRLRVWLARWRHWEFWPAWLFYAPVFINYLRLALRHRGVMLPTAANPGIFSGGIVGESKMATLGDLRITSPEFTAEAHLIAGATPDARRDAIQRLITARRISYPFILKPDVGQRGVGVKLIRDEHQANEYLRSTIAPIICQRYAPGPNETGVFYYRFPHEARGHIFAITEKIFPVIVGDGVCTVEELIWADPRARFLADKYLARLEERRDEILPYGQALKLVEAGNHAQGCIFRDGMHLWSEELERRIDDISQKLNGFFIGRYDIRYSCEADLRGGNNFQIIELNGAASEATSIYDAQNSLWNAYRTLFRQWELVFAIGAANRRRGSRPTTLPLLWHAWRQTAALIATYPAAD